MVRFPVLGVVLTVPWGKCMPAGGLVLATFVTPLPSESEVSESESDVESESAVGGVGELLEGVITNSRFFTCSSSRAGKVMHIGN